MSGPLAALQFLTRVPIRLRREPSLTATVGWFPFAGAVIGAGVGGAAAAAWYVLPPMLAGAVGVAVGLLVTGAFHEDGLADVADAFGGGWTVKRRLEIMKDPRHGTYGVAAMCTSIVVRMLALGSLPGPAAMFWSAVVAHVVARAAALAVMGTVPLARHEGLGADYGRSASPTSATVGVASGVILAAAALLARFGPHASVLGAASAVFGAAVVAAVATSVLARRKIGGISGDVLGSVEQVAEILVLVALASSRLPGMTQ